MRLTTESFIERAKQVHGADRYDYSKVVFTTTKNKVEIICYKHQSFFQEANAHIRGQGCPKCSVEKRSLEQRKSVDQFIADAKALHGDTYSYDQVEYTNSNTPVKIKCNICGNEFMQKPGKHIEKTSKGGCMVCFSERNKLTTADFTKKAKFVFGDIYDYSSVNYANTSDKVIILCKTHGPFSISPESHLQGRGCQKCGLEKVRQSVLLTQYEFIERSKLTHGDSYNYSLVEYIHIRSKVKLICGEHGIFEIIPHDHLNGSGCQKCARERTRKSHIRSKESFIEKALSIHGESYDYSLIEYEKRKTKVKIICRRHNIVFEQAPNCHLNGNGCPRCAADSIGDSKRKTLNTFISEARNVHGSKYDYSEVVYVNSFDKVVITCDKGHIFMQSPSMHIRGNGCPNCSESTGEGLIAHALSELKIDYITQATFSTCKSKKTLRFDFKVFIDSSFLLIEYDGRQHFEPISYFGGTDVFESTKERDKIKDDWAKTNGIPLIRIPYTCNTYEAVKELLIEKLNISGSCESTYPSELPLFT